MKQKKAYRLTPDILRMPAAIESFALTRAVVNSVLKVLPRHLPVMVSRDRGIIEPTGKTVGYFLDQHNFVRDQSRPMEISRSTELDEGLRVIGVFIDTAGCVVFHID